MNIRISKEVVANFQFGSSNSKTGDAVQITSVPQAMIDHGKADTALDSAVCFDCTYSNGRGCYVTKGTAYMGLKSKVKSLHKKLSFNNWDEILAKVREYKYIRFGSYGEPILLSIKQITQLIEKASTWTGYTHQWRNAKYDEYKKYFMASVETVEAAMKAQSMGWRYFFVIKKDYVLPEGITIDGHKLKCGNKTIAINCPASKESGKKLTCSTCGFCKGMMGPKINIWTYKH